MRSLSFNMPHVLPDNVWRWGTFDLILQRDVSGFTFGELTCRPSLYTIFISHIVRGNLVFFLSLPTFQRQQKLYTSEAWTCWMTIIKTVQSMRWSSVCGTSCLLFFVWLKKGQCKKVPHQKMPRFIILSLDTDQIIHLWVQVCNTLFRDRFYREHLQPCLPEALINLFLGNNNDKNCVVFSSRFGAKVWTTIDKRANCQVARWTCNMQQVLHKRKLKHQEWIYLICPLKRVL